MNYVDFPKSIIVEDFDNPIEIMNKYAKTLFFSKQKVWKYELEYRLMIFPDGKAETFLNNINDALIAIILGINFPNIYKINILELKGSYYPSGKLFQMYWDSEGYFKVSDLNSNEERYRCSEVLNDYVIDV